MGSPSCEIVTSDNHMVNGFNIALANAGLVSSRTVHRTILEA